MHIRTMCVQVSQAYQKLDPDLYRNVLQQVIKKIKVCICVANRYGTLAHQSFRWNEYLHHHTSRIVTSTGIEWRRWHEAILLPEL
jgi:hypothetical protein